MDHLGVVTRSKHCKPNIAGLRKELSVHRRAGAWNVAHVNAATRSGDASRVQSVGYLLGADAPVGTNVFDDRHKVFVSLGCRFAADSWRPRAWSDPGHRHNRDCFALLEPAHNPE